jgi:LysM repeat protein
MIFENRHFVLYDNLGDSEFIREQKLNTLNGSVLTITRLENYVDSYERIFSLIQRQFELFFERFYYRNPTEAMHEAIIHIARQIHLEAMHDELLYNSHFSIIVILFREHEMFAAQVGDLSLSEININSADKVATRLLPEQEYSNKHLSTDNFHDLEINVFRSTPQSNELYFITEKGVIEDETKLDLIDDIDFLNKDLTSREIDAQIQHIPFALIRTKELIAYQHDADTGIFGKLFSLSYFQEIPKLHIWILGIVVAIILTVIVIYNPIEAIHNLEEKLLSKGESIVKEEFKEIESEIKKSDSTKVIKEDSIKANIVAPTPKNLYASFKVQKGQNLYRISKNFNVNMDELSKLNNLEKYLIHPNQIIKIPIRGIHVVYRGETLQNISQKYGLTREQILFCNQISESQLVAGMKLYIANE